MFCNERYSLIFYFLLANTDFLFNIYFPISHHSSAELRDDNGRFFCTGSCNIQKGEGANVL
jgi:hypothetical protein